jgi:hypothetical protein
MVHFDRFAAPGGGFGAGNLPNWTTRNSQWWKFHFDRFGRPLRAGWGAGACPTKQQQIINDKQLIDDCPPPDPALGAGSWAGTCPTEQQEILNNKRFTSTNLAAPKGRVLGRGSALLEEHENFNTVRPPLTKLIRQWSHFTNGCLRCRMYYGYGKAVMRLRKKMLQWRMRSYKHTSLSNVLSPIEKWAKVSNLYTYTLKHTQKA